jgi:hypothetical protein
MIPAHIEHTFAAIDRILNPGPQQPMPGNPALVERPSPCDDARTAGVVDLCALVDRKQNEIQRLHSLVDFYRTENGGYERTLRAVRDLLRQDNFDDASDLVRDFLRGIDGPECE